MSVIKVIEVLSDSEMRWVRNIRSIYINDHSATVKNGEITNYRINARISFELD